MLLLGSVVHYVIATPFGNYVLPARVVAFEGEGAQVNLRIFTDVNGSEWLASAKYSALKQPGTYHLKEGATGECAQDTR